MSLDPALIPFPVRQKAARGHVRWGLALSGGAALGAVQPPIVEAVEEHLGRPSIIAGVSIGANNGAMVAESRYGDLKRMWMDVRGTKTFQRRTVDVWNGLFSLAPLRRLHDDLDTCRELQCPTYVGMVDAATRQYQSVLLNDLSVPDRRDAVVASSSQPFIHRHSKFQGRWKLDGGIAHVLPKIPGWRSLDYWVAVFCSPIGRARKPLDRPPPQRDVAQAVEQAEIAMEMLLDRVVTEDFRRLKRRAQIVPGIVFAPQSWEQVGKSFDAEPARIRHRWHVVSQAMLKDPVLASGV